MGGAQTTHKHDQPHTSPRREKPCYATNLLPRNPRPERAGQGKSKNNPVYTLSPKHKTFILDTDASNDTIEAVLFHEQADDDPRTQPSRPTKSNHRIQLSRHTSPSPIPTPSPLNRGAQAHTLTPHTTKGLPLSHPMTRPHRSAPGWQQQNARSIATQQSKK